MRALSKSVSIRSKLMGMMALAVVPVALLSIGLAFTVYSSALRDIEISQRHVADEYASRILIWLRSAQPSMLAAEAGVAAANYDPQICRKLFERAFAGMPFLKGAWISNGAGRSCRVGVPGVADQEIDQFADFIRVQPTFTSYADQQFYPARLEYRRVSNADWLGLYTRFNLDSSTTEVVLLVDPALLDGILKSGSANLSRVDLLTTKNELVASNGAAPVESSAQSKREPSWFEKMVMQMTNVSGAKLAFASAPAPASQMRVEARMDDTGRHAAWTLFLILAITPLVLLGLVYMVYARAIARDVMYWIYGVKNAALERIANPASTRMALVSPSMPRELARVAEAFNNMLTDLSAREGALKASLVENEFLTRELHHRVKNSLQVIQSYLSLSERLQKGPPNSEVQATTARVHVLSIAYRLALADGRMRPIPIDLFAEEVVSSSMASLRKTGQWISVEALTHGVLNVDRAIPFGLAIVEAVLAGLRASEISTLHVIVQAAQNGALNLVVEGDAAPCPDDPNPKILRGLSLQMEAQVLHPEGDQIINWVFSA